MARHITILITIVVAGFILLSFTSSSLGSISSVQRVMHDADLARETTSEGDAAFGALSGNILEGGSIAPKLENATAKYVSSIFPLANTYHSIPGDRIESTCSY